MLNRNHLCEELGEEHSRKKRQARDVGSEGRSGGLGSHELGELSLSALSVIFSLTLPLVPVPALVHAYGIFLCQLLSLYLPNS